MLETYQSHRDEQSTKKDEETVGNLSKRRKKQTSREIKDRRMRIGGLEKSRKSAVVDGSDAICVQENFHTP